MNEFNHQQKIIAVLPAYNAAKTLTATLADIPKNLIDEIILVDDASSDGTADLAKSLGLKIFRHQNNLGYGGNQKTCYQKALAAEADIVVMVHPDHQYDPQFIPQILTPIISGECDACFGSRMIWPGQALKGGMPFWKYLANKVLTKIENWFLGINLTEYHSGFRAYSKKVLETVPFALNSDDFVFDTEIIVQLVANDFKIKEIPITTKYFKDASSINFWRSVKYGMDILKIMILYQLDRWRLKKNLKFKKSI
ncbi:MAG: glycosyl transferase family 2 [Candidatus Buchananbacteria bacterium RIFCSPHIGHO2_01_FULL_39_14]|uniref:Glycosyl transferase family 2 n=2 Tax=Candidatus Buchananiibacteriota TaxID=1817903 RepID=A0A1G1YQN5_9BACT|nr:MAG: glycosyl transferase family 2 [Candidatus Buchananbacteria bacterium RIFCSPHIGHO2_01_FULL_39_14]OGY48831.1 MAG: glycosyl transferase family 2 [Candidatus Buchananbacteria bacterium RIFCSPHIGHO2_02_FULL_39_17]OGY54116.1 MAG: glycosyl transferase family 2 [Candidatus Buchananbacteria bacterium RIFCSPLOWO2_01_FULL_40_23b]